MSSIKYSQRVFCLSHDEAIDACSRIGYLVAQLGLGGIAGLSIERALYTALYLEVCELNSSPAALEYIEHRRKETSAQLDIMRSCSPDLFDGWCERNGIENLLQLVPQLMRGVRA
jgi:hypothetical protein